MQAQQGSLSLELGSDPFPDTCDICRGDTRDLPLSMQVHLGWRKHLAIGFASIGCSELTFISVVVDLTYCLVSL